MSLDNHREFLSSIQDLTSTDFLATSFSYHPNGMVSTVTRGNGVVDHQSLQGSAMARPAKLWTTGASSDWDSGTYRYDAAGNVTTLGGSLFTYDGVSRLAGAEVATGQDQSCTGDVVLSNQTVTSPQTWESCAALEAGPFTVAAGADVTFRAAERVVLKSGFAVQAGATFQAGTDVGLLGGGPTLARTYTYDAFGNLNDISGENGRSIPVDSGTNRLASATYDAAGNVTSWNGTSFEYDAMGMLTKRTDFGGGERLFFYTADDERFWSYHSSGSRWTLRDLDGKVLRDYRSGPAGWSVERDYVYADGKLLAATQPGTSTVYHYHLDHLGTPRLITDRNATRLAFHTYFPYGEEATSWSQDSERMKFTSHERDFYEPGAGDDLDYQHARYYNIQIGRFLSVDPEVRTDKLEEPESWNLYSYATGNPLNHIDPNGREAIIFIVDEGRNNLAEKAGHAAIYVGLGDRQAGISYGGDHDFANGVMEFLKGYLGSGRSVTAYFLDTTPSQDKRMLDFIMKHPGDGGVDRASAFANIMLRENCTKAVCNVLQAGGLVDNPERQILGYFDVPASLRTTLDHGFLKKKVDKTFFINPKKKNHRLTLDQVRSRVDPFAGTGFKSADDELH